MSMKTINEIQDEIIEDFSGLEEATTKNLLRRNIRQTRT